MFNRIDSGDDKKINFEEFCQALPQIQEWGVTVEDPEATFKEVDANGGGQILFQEFSDWAIAKNMDLLDDDDDI